MAQRLSNMKINEISLVDNPAAPESRITLYKRDGDDMGKNMDQPKMTARQKLAQALGLTDDEDEEVLDDVEKAVAAVASVDETNEITYAAGDMSKVDGDDMPEFDPSGLTPEAAEYLKGVEAERDVAVAKAAEFEKSVAEVEKSDDDKRADIEKSATPEVLEYIRKVEAEASEASTIAKVERENRLVREFITKAEEIPYIGEERTTVGSLLKSISEKVDADTFAQLDTVLKAANAQLSEGLLFKEAGLAGAGTTGDAYAQLEGIAKSMVEGNSDLTPEAAFEKATASRPELYERYLAEQGA